MLANNIILEGFVKQEQNTNQSLKWRKEIKTKTVIKFDGHLS